MFSVAYSLIHSNPWLSPQGYIAKGTLVPDDVMVNLILNALKDQEAKMDSGRCGWKGKFSLTLLTSMHCGPE